MSAKFKVSVTGSEVQVLRVVCGECGQTYLTLCVGDEYEPFCAYCGAVEVSGCAEAITYELQGDGSLVDIRTLTKKEPASDPSFCERCQNLIEDCECGTEAFEEYMELFQEEDSEEGEADFEPEPCQLDPSRPFCEDCGDCMNPPEEQEEEEQPDPAESKTKPRKKKWVI